MLPRAAGVEVRHPWRVQDAQRQAEGFVLTSDRDEALRADRLVLATGGRSLPRTGSDGGGFELARRLGHSITERVFPALVPLTLPSGHVLRELSGLSARATLEVRGSTGRARASFTDWVLCTHFGISGPAALDVSRYLIDARLDDPQAQLVANWLPGVSEESFETVLRDPATGPARYLAERLPERLARALLADAGVAWDVRGHQLTREGTARAGAQR